MTEVSGLIPSCFSNLTMLVKYPSCLSKLTMLVKSHHVCHGIKNKTNWHQELTCWIWLMKYPLVDPKFSLFQEKLSEIPLVSLGEISDTFTLDSENLGSTSHSGISAKFHLSTLVSVGFILKLFIDWLSQSRVIPIFTSGPRPNYLCQLPVAEPQN